MRIMLEASHKYIKKKTFENYRQEFFKIEAENCTSWRKTYYKLPYR